MGIFYSAAEKSTLEDLLRWVESNKTEIYSGITDTVYSVLSYDDLVAELKKRIAESDFD